MELVRFDMQKMQNAEISGVEYQQGELLGYEVREYLLEKWGRECVYCGKQLEKADLLISKQRKKQCRASVESIARAFIHPTAIQHRVKALFPPKPEGLGFHS